MARLIYLLLIPLLVAAQDRWVEVRSGPFQVFSNAGDRPVRDVLNQLEQVRYLLGASLGKEDLKSEWPLRILVSKAALPGPPVPKLARDSYVAALPAGAPMPPQWLRECVRILIESNSGRMPVSIESGLEDFYSTAQASGTKITLGAPPPSSGPDWARMRLLELDPAYSGRLRVLLYNLQRGADLEPAYRNAFGKLPGDVDKEVAAMLASGSFPTSVVGGRPLNAQRDFTPRAVEGFAAAVALADLRCAGAGDAQSAYQALAARAPAEAHEGLGLLALQANRKAEAAREFAASIAAGSTSARAWFESARLEPDAAKAAAALRKAAELNPNWSEPYAALAAIETDPSRQLQAWKTAATLAPRNAAYLQRVAELYQTHNKFPEAARAWAAAEGASVDEAERERIREARRGIDERRVEYEAAEQKRREEERTRDLQRVKDSAMAEVRAAEERANQAHPRSPTGKLEKMEIGGLPAGKARGQLTRIDCLAGAARFVVRSPEGQTVRLLVRDPKTVVVLSGGELAFQCGAQTPPKKVAVEYQPKADAKLGTAGEVVTVTFE